MISYNLQYDYYLTYFNNQLKLALNAIDAPSALKEAMEYAVVGGGKRIRPVLCLAVADMLGVKLDRVARYAVAIELIHSYSLVHDDLPAMDNDDYRRGQLSTHKKFGEAIGILTGDALLNYAFEFCLETPNFDKHDAKALKILANYAGCSGMIAGQVLDLQNEHNNQACEKVLYEIYNNKTAKLLTAPLLIASVMAEDKYYNQLESFGYHLGAMFQIVDDIMDVEGTVESIGKTPNKDADVDKLTAIKLFGVDGARSKVLYHYTQCKNILEQIDASAFIIELTEKMYTRNR